MQGNKRTSTQEAGETNRILINKVATFTASKQEVLVDKRVVLAYTQMNVLIEKKKLSYLEQRNLESQ